MEKKHDLYLILSTETRFGYETLRLRVVTQNESGHIRNLSSGHALCNLELHAQRNVDRKEKENDPKFYAFHIQYTDVFSVNLGYAETLVKTLRKINRAMEKINENWGYTDDLGTYALRFAKTIKALGFYESENGLNYDSWQSGPRAITDLTWFIHGLEEK